MENGMLTLLLIHGENKERSFATAINAGAGYFNTPQNHR